MGAFVDHDFNNGFILDEERLRKINQILSTRGEDFSNACKPIYKIYRADNYSYETEDIQLIMEEDNSDWQKITRLEISMRNENIFSLTLDFNEEATSLQIEGENRDEVFLIFSELKQYMSNEVNILKPIYERISKILSNLVYILMLVVIGLMFYSINNLFNTTNQINQKEVLRTDDINAKLNYLIEKDINDPNNIPSFFWPPLFLLIIIIVIRIFGTEKILFPIKYLFPSNIFLFGNEIDKHKKRKNLRSNLLWGVIVSSIVGLITGLIVWLITK